MSADRDEVHARLCVVVARQANRTTTVSFGVVTCHVIVSVGQGMPCPYKNRLRPLSSLCALCVPAYPPLNSQPADHFAEPPIDRLDEFSPCTAFANLARRGLGASHEVDILQEVRGPKLRQEPVLVGPKEVAGSADAEILLRNRKAVRCVSKRSQPAARFLRLRVGKR